MTLLGASIVVCIGAIVFSAASDLNRRLVVGQNERAGLVTIVTLARLFEDASASNGPAVQRDIAAMDALEARHPLARGDWRAARSDRSKPEFVDDLAGLFPLVSDRSGLTYDPDVAGIDLADSLTYRLPVAIDQLQRASAVLASSAARTVPGRLALAQDAGHAAGYLNDGLGETQEAAGLNRDFERIAGAAGRRAQVSTDAALDALRAFEQNPASRGGRAAARSVRSGIADLYALMGSTEPALGALLDSRTQDLGKRRADTLLLGLVAILGAIGFVLFGTRSALARAELARVRSTAAELHFHANHDALTGLANRIAFVTGVDEALGRLRGHGGALAVLFIDLDDFKLVNDGLGHEAGDKVLIAVARRLEAVATHRTGALFARFGGDEFAMMLEASGDNIHEVVSATVAEISAKMAEPLTIDETFDRGVIISTSVGIATLVDDGRQRAATDLLREADAAMYEAKAAGRARAETFGPAMLERATRKFMLANDLRGATERGEFALELQPFVDLASGRTMAAEALIRWMHPTLGLLGPGAFLSVAEGTGSMVAIGRWVLEEAIRLVATGGAPGAAIHVNVSVGELLDDRLDGHVAEMLDRYGVEPSRLAIEVIEGSVIRSGDRSERMLGRLRTMGVQIWIDDFGVEYSSLQYLHRLPIDGVKIDRSFVGGADGSLGSRPIVRAILELARSLDLAVVAEGIETERQRAELLELGCARGQGFLFPALKATRPQIEAARAFGKSRRPRRAS